LKRDSRARGPVTEGYKVEPPGQAASNKLQA